MGCVCLLVLKSNSEGETRAIGKILGETALPGMVIALNGELGAGKTVLVQGIAEGLGVKGGVTSPSYVLMNTYQGRLKLYHFDFYRLEEEEELKELGLEEFFYGEGVAVIEWAGKFPRALPRKRLEVEIVKDEEDLENSRWLYLKSLDGKNDALFKELRRRCCFWL